MRNRWAAVVALSAVTWTALLQAEPPPAVERGRAVNGAGPHRSAAAARSPGAVNANKQGEVASAVKAGKQGQAESGGKAGEAARAAKAGKKGEAANQQGRGPAARPPRASLDKRVEKLKQRAAELRAGGQEEQASRLEKQAELLAKHPRVGRAHGAQPPQLRKRARIKRWHARYGEALQRPAVQAELRHHGLRMAKLQRMKELARQKSDVQQRDALLQRIDALRARENARHGRAMERLAASPNAAGGRAPAAQAALGNEATTERGRAVSEPGTSPKPTSAEKGMP